MFSFRGKSDAKFQFDQWLIARGEPLKERGGKAFRASEILAFRNGPSPSCL
jgi:hypothetical protein